MAIQKIPGAPLEGQEGIETYRKLSPLVPNLAGQEPHYLVKAIKAGEEIGSRLTATSPPA